MPNQESTAINDLIHLVQGRRLERISENPVPEIYVTAASLRPEAAPPRVATGTRPPPIQAQAPLAVPVPLPPQVAPPKKAQKKVYRIPANAVTSAAIEHDHEQTEQWNNAQIDTAPAVPSIAPHAATVIAAQQAPVIPAILRGPSGPENPVDRAAAARAAVERQVAEAAAAARAPQAHASHAHSRALPAPAVSMLPYPAFTIPVAPPSPVKPPSPASWLIAREVLTSWGSLAVIAAIALGIGIYVAVATNQTEPTVTAPTERDRAIAIMNGTAQPEPEPTVVHAPAEAPSEAPVTTPRPASFDAVAPTAPTAEPIEPEPTKPEVVAATEDAAEDDEAIDADAIEIEPMNARPSKRAIRRAARAKAKSVAKADPVVAAKADKRRSDDPVLAILNEKPAKPSKFEKAAQAKAAADEKKLAEKKAKKVKEPTGAATEIAAPKGAALAKGTGKVMITSDVAAMIYLDGRPTGKTSPTALVIPAGDHQITLLDPSTKKAKTATIQIAANKSVSVRKDFH
jgi:hypothetical protein